MHGFNPGVAGLAYLGLVLGILIGGGIGNFYASILPLQAKGEQRVNYPEMVCPSRYNWKCEICSWCPLAGRGTEPLSTGLYQHYLARLWAVLHFPQLLNYLVATYLSKCIVKREITLD